MGAPMSSGLYLLDTNVLVALINGKDLGRTIDATYGLRTSKVRPLVCIVSHGELWALARVNDFGDAKRAAIGEMLDSVVTIDISDDAVITSYAIIYEALRNYPKGARTNTGENDMWIAAATLAAGATLLTCDVHFDPLCPAVINRVYVPKHSRLGPPTSTS
jgi:tRNA(fMet)-specific endonuclease VapC